MEKTKEKFICREEMKQAVSFKESCDARECVSFDSSKMRKYSEKPSEEVPDESEDKVNVVIDGEIALVDLMEPLVPRDRGFVIPMRQYVPLDQLEPSARAAVISQINAGQANVVEGKDKPELVMYGLRKRNACLASHDIPCITEGGNQGLEFVAPNYALRDGVTYFVDGDKKPIPIFRGRLFCNRIQRQIERDGKIRSVQWEIKVVSASEFKCCWLDDHKVSKEIVGLMRSVRGITIEKGSDNFIRNLVSLLAEKAEEKTVYVEAGWQKIGDKFLFLHDLRSEKFQINTQKRVCEVRGEDCCDIFRRALEMFDDKNLAGPMLLYSLYGVMYFLFEQAGYRPTTILFISGKTGSLKTSVSKVLYRMWNTEEDEEIMSFQSTSASIEPMIKECCDSIFLIDDYCVNAVNDTSVKRSMAKNLDVFLRYFGDSVSKKKSNLAGELISAPRPRGGAVVTGEVSSNGESSLLRTLTVCIPQEGINGKVLAVFQRNRNLWSTFLGNFVRFCEVHFGQIVDQIRNDFESLRQAAEAKFEARRSVDHWVELYEINMVLLRFLLGQGMKQEEVEDIGGILLHGVDVHIQNSEKLAQQEDPKKVLLDAVIEAIRSHLHFASSRQEFMLSEEYDGYVCDTKGYVLKAPLINGVNTVLHLENLSVEKLNFSWRIIPKIMYEQYGLFGRMKNGSDFCYVTYINVSQSKRERAFVINWEKLQDYSDKGEEEMV